MISGSNNTNELNNSNLKYLWNLELNHKCNLRNDNCVNIKLNSDKKKKKGKLSYYNTNWHNTYNTQYTKLVNSMH